jgi:hypothetical protein
MTTAGKTLEALIDLAPTVHSPSTVLTAAAAHAFHALGAESAEGLEAKERHVIAGRDADSLSLPISCRAGLLARFFSFHTNAAFALLATHHAINL